MNPSDRTEIDAAGRLRCKHRGECGPRQLAADDDLLLITTRQRADDRVAIGGANVELGDPRIGKSGDGLAIDLERAGDVGTAEREVLGDRRIEDEAAMLTILRDVRETRREAMRR